MFDLKDLQSAKEKLSVKRSENSDGAYNEGIKILDLYKKQPSIDILEQAGKKFIESLEFNKEHMPSLIYLSYIFYVLNNEEMALKYFRMVESIQPELPEELMKYKNEVENKLEEKFSRYKK